MQCPRCGRELPGGSCADCGAGTELVEVGATPVDAATTAPQPLPAAAVPWSTDAEPPPDPDLELAASDTEPSFVVPVHVEATPGDLPYYPEESAESAAPGPLDGANRYQPGPETRGWYADADTVRKMAPPAARSEPVELPPRFLSGWHRVERSTGPLAVVVGAHVVSLIVALIDDGSGLFGWLRLFPLVVELFFLGALLRGAGSLNTMYWATLGAAALDTLLLAVATSGAFAGALQALWCASFAAAYFVETPKARWAAAGAGVFLAAAAAVVVPIRAHSAARDWTRLAEQEGRYRDPRGAFTLELPPGFHFFTPANAAPVVERSGYSDLTGLRGVAITREGAFAAALAVQRLPADRPLSDLLVLLGQPLYDVPPRDRSLVPAALRDRDAEAWDASQSGRTTYMLAARLDGDRVLILIARGSVAATRDRGRFSELASGLRLGAVPEPP